MKPLKHTKTTVAERRRRAIAASIAHHRKWLAEATRCGRTYDMAFHAEQVVLLERQACTR